MGASASTTVDPTIAAAVPLARAPRWRRSRTRWSSVEITSHAAPTHNAACAAKRRSQRTNCGVATNALLSGGVSESQSNQNGMTRAASTAATTPSANAWTVEGRRRLSSRLVAVGGSRDDERLHGCGKRMILFRGSVQTRPNPGWVSGVHGPLAFDSQGCPAPRRRSIDLAGPPLRDLPTSARAQEPARRRGDSEADRGLSLGEALELTILIARKDPRRHTRMALVTTLPRGARPRDDR